MSKMSVDEKEEWIEVFDILKRTMPEEGYARVKSQVISDRPELESILNADS